MWISMTFIFMLFTGGNIWEYIRGGEAWSGEILKLIIATAIVLSYLIGLPFICSLILHDQQINFIEVASLYGYSFLVFIPACVLAILPFVWFRWAVMFLGTTWSLLLLQRNMWDRMEESNRRLLICAIILIGHISLVLVSEFYFFAKWSLNSI